MTYQRINKSTNFKKVITPIIVLILVIIGGLVVIKATLLNNHSPGSVIVKNQTESDLTLPDFKLTRLDGTTFYFSEIRDKIVLINFWATWCEACMVEMPSLIRLHKAFKNHGFQVLGINLDENPEMIVPKIIKEFKIEFPMLIDPDQKLADMFDVHAIPLTIILNQDRKVLLVKSGEENWDSPQIHANIKQWLNE